MKVFNMKSEKTGREVPNQFIIKDGNKIYFQSYDTVIAVFDDFELILDDNAEGYSRTTSKYLWRFIHTYYVTGYSGKSLKEFLKNGVYSRANLNA